MDQFTPPQIVLSHALARYKKSELARHLEINPVTVSRWMSGENMSKRDLLALLYLLDTPRPPAQKTYDFRFADIFAGIGGMRLGFEEPGIDGKCVFTSEWDEGCQKTYRENFPYDDHEVSGDIQDITQPEGYKRMPEDELRDFIREKIPEHDVLLAGFPCQPFSLAGVSKKNSLGRAHGFACEAQGTLFFDVAKILWARRPAAFVLENVKNLYSHDGGKTFRVIMDVLEKELNYKVYHDLRDAKGFVPQHRERVFIVGFREHAGFSWAAIPKPDPASRVLGDILHTEDGTEEPERHYTMGTMARVNSKKYVLSDHLWNYLKAYKEKHEKKGNGFGFGLFGEKEIARTLSARYHKDGSEILIKRKKGNPRRLTPRECSRLMGFDYGDRRFIIPESTSDTRAYQQFGNAVVVPVVTQIAKAMKQPLLELLEAEQSGARQPHLL